MRRRQMTLQGLKGLFLVVLILASCSAPSDDNPAQGCGGTEAAVSCLSIASIAPTGGGNVDAFAHVCTTDPTTGAVTTVEHLTDDNATVTLSNTKFPTALGTFDIRVIGYSISYELNGPCPSPSVAQACPSLAPLSFQATIVVPAGTSAPPQTLALVPLSVKLAYARNFNVRLSIPVLSYTAHYVFTAQTVGLNDMFTVEANTTFEIADFSGPCSAP
jgi:hypothetical protein